MERNPKDPVEKSNRVIIEILISVLSSLLATIWVLDAMGITQTGH